MTTISLTRGQVSAVRAAAKAGIKPSVIARQFAYPNQMCGRCWRPTPRPRRSISADARC